MMVVSAPVRAPSLSVIVPAYRATATLSQALEALRRSAYGDFELIVVDDGSGDGTAEAAARFANRVVRLPKRGGRSGARNAGASLAAGRILVFVDSDVVVKPESLGRIARYFEEHPEIDAVTGLLSKEHPHPGFFSQYKNLYMNFIFRGLPERVSFLYGSIHAVRRRSWLPHGGDVEIADDTALGQKMAACGGEIAFLRELEVIHLKKHSFLSFLKNDFRIPFDWAQIFVRYRGWREVGKNGRGFLHAPRWQLAAVAAAPLIVLSAAASLLLLSAGLLGLWLLLTSPLHRFLYKEKGPLFSLLSIPVTLLDNLTMAAGIACGFLYSMKSRRHE